MSEPTSVGHEKSIHWRIRKVLRVMEKNYKDYLLAAGIEEALSLKSVSNFWLTPGNVVAVAVEPGSDATELLLRLLAYSSQKKEGVLVYSSVESPEGLVLRLLAYLCGRDTLRLGDGKMMESDWPAVTCTARVLMDGGVVIIREVTDNLKQVRKDIEMFPTYRGELRLVILEELLSAGAVAAMMNDADDIEQLFRDLESIAIDCGVSILFTWPTHDIVDVSDESVISSIQTVLPEKYHQFIKASMMLRKEGSGQRLSLYDTDTGISYATQLVL